MKKSTIVLLLLVVLALVLLPIFVAKDAEFGGADDQAEDVIADIDENYEPWFEPPIGDLPGEIESALFALQAAIGAGLIGYYIGTQKSKEKNSKQANA
ncbi:MAG: energy-coupling factor ABC transporter substrate-binding protein [Eubacteriales bacterium]|nr:energy-coupling factor ABC transporter substrate-binding protein [Eubacteriales bacterium]